MNEMFERIAQWEADEMAQSRCSGTNESVNFQIAVRRKFDKMRRDYMAMAFNAEQFNRRAAFMRKTGCSNATAKGMFPTASGV